MLRIEDTDQERFVEGAMENLIGTLKWVGIDYDEGPQIHEDGSIKQIGDCGPYIQSDRTELYKGHAEKLLESGHAYHCFCTKERLTELRGKQEAAKQATMYDRKCAEIPLEEARKRAADGESFVIRQKIPYENMKFKDLIRGNVQFDGKNIDDQVLVKSDGFPTYHLANVVDDHLMKITHVIRGEEWLPSTPKHIFLYKAFGWEEPEFAHIPLLLNKDRSKLSKRQGHVAVEHNNNEGYLREAITNFVALLGWHPGAGEENELFSLEDLEKTFSLDRVHKAGAIFDIEKLDWFNWLWKRKIFNEEMQKIAENLEKGIKRIDERPRTLPYKFSSKTLEDKFLKEKGDYLFELCKNDLTEEQRNKDKNIMRKALAVSDERIFKFPKEIKNNLDYFFELKDLNTKILEHPKIQITLDKAKFALKTAKNTLVDISEDRWTEEELQKELIALAQSSQLKNGQLLWPIRAATSGEQFSPGAFEMLWALGKTESLERIQTAITKL